MKKQSFIKYLVPIVALSIYSCSNQLTTDQNGNKLTTVSQNSGITPKTTTGQTILNLKNGDNSLVLNLKVSSGSNFTGDGSPAFSTKADAASSTSSDNKLDKIKSDLTINSDKFNFEIPASEINDNQHKINITGLKSGDIVNYDGKAYDSKGNVIGSQTVKDKKVEKDIETLDVKISVNISVNVNQNVTVNQSQTVTGPTINIILPSQQPAQQYNGPCYPAPPPDNTATLEDGTKVRVCGPETPAGTKCYRMDNNNLVKIDDGRIVSICKGR